MSTPDIGQLARPAHANGWRDSHLLDNPSANVSGMQEVVV